MKNLALWGYGFHGKDIEAVILRSKTEEFRITAIFDKRYEELNRNISGRTFLDPDRITDYFRQGLFDAVIIGVYDAEQKHDIEIRLQVLEIPVIDDEKTLDNRFLFRRPEYFRQGQASFVWQERDGYECHTLRDIRMSFVRNCDIVFLFGEDGRILSSNWQDYQFCDAPYLRLFLPPDPKETVFLKGEWCMLSDCWSTNYWHFTYESMDRMWLLEKSGYTGSYVLPKTSAAAELASLLDVGPDRILWREDLDHIAVYQFEMLVCAKLIDADRAKSAPVLLEMAEHILNRLKPERDTYPRRLFVKRIGMRRMRLNKQTQALLDRYGFEMIVPEELSVSEQILCFHNADIVLSPHGANSTNSLYMRPGTAFIEAFPYNYPNPCCIETSYLAGLHYLPVTEPHAEAGGPKKPFLDYSIPSHLLEMIIKNAIRLTGSQL